MSSLKKNPQIARITTRKQIKYTGRSPKKKIIIIISNSQLYSSYVVFPKVGSQFQYLLYGVRGEFPRETHTAVRVQKLVEVRDAFQVQHGGDLDESRELLSDRPRARAAEIVDQGPHHFVQGHATQPVELGLHDRLLQLHRALGGHGHDQRVVIVGREFGLELTKCTVYVHHQRLHERVVRLGLSELGLGHLVVFLVERFDPGQHLGFDQGHVQLPEPGLVGGHQQGVHPAKVVQATVEFGRGVPVARQPTAGRGYLVSERLRQRLAVLNGHLRVVERGQKRLPHLVDQIRGREPVEVPGTGVPGGQGLREERAHVRLQRVHRVVNDRAQHVQAAGPQRTHHALAHDEKHVVHHAGRQLVLLALDRVHHHRFCDALLHIVPLHFQVFAH